MIQSSAIVSTVVSYPLFATAASTSASVSYGSFHE